MSATTVDESFVADVRSTPRVPFGRMVRVEMRKMADTRAGLWLLLTVAIVTAGVVVGTLATAEADERMFATFFFRTTIPQGFLVPVLGILLVTGEWGQRTTLTTFALEPSRTRVMVAKVVAALGYGTVLLALSALLAAAATAVAGGPGAWESATLALGVNVVLVQWAGVLMGVAFGALVLSSAGAIVLFFAVPIVFDVLGTLVEEVRERQAWFDQFAAQLPLMSTEFVSGEQWTQFGVTAAIWILLPLVLGLGRVRRMELK